MIMRRQPSSRTRGLRSSSSSLERRKHASNRVVSEALTTREYVLPLKTTQEVSNIDDTDPPACVNIYREKCRDRQDYYCTHRGIRCRRQRWGTPRIRWLPSSRVIARLKYFVFGGAINIFLTGLQTFKQTKYTVTPEYVLSGGRWRMGRLHSSPQWTSWSILGQF